MSAQGIQTEDERIEVVVVIVKMKRSKDHCLYQELYGAMGYLTPDVKQAFT